MSASPPPPSLRVDVQGLRALAILAVLLFHFFPEYFKNGYLGVDIFFVISGFLITTILSKQDSFNLQSVISFYFRRIKRILPMYLVFECGAILLYTQYSTQDEIPEQQNNTYASLGFYTNIMNMKEQIGYWERLKSDSLFTHTWSLCVEMQFYLVVPFLFLLHHLLSRSPRPFARLFFPMVLFFSLSLFVFVDAKIGFNLMFARLWQFFSTTALLKWAKEERIEPEEAEKLVLEEHEEEKNEDKFSVQLEEQEPVEHVTVKRSWMSNGLQSARYWIFLALLLIPFMGHEVNQTLGRILVTGATATLIVFGEEQKNLLLCSSPMELLGDISYTLYLVHWPFVVYYVKLSEPLSYDRLILIPYCLGVTLLAYYGFEKYYRKWRNHWTAIFIIFMYVIALDLVRRAPETNKPIYEKKQKQLSTKIQEALAHNQHTFQTYVWNDIIDGCHFEVYHNYSEPMRPVPHITPPFGICHMDNGTGKLRFAIIGNSYGVNQGDQVFKHFKPFYSSFDVFTQVECEVLADTKSEFCLNLGNYTEMLEKFNPDVTFIMQRWFAIKNPPAKPGQPDPEAEEIIRNMKKLLPFSKLFYILDTIPSFDTKAYGLLDQMIKQGMSAEEINAKIVHRDDDLGGKIRTRKLVDSCKDKCRLYDISPAFRDEKSRFIVIDPDTLHTQFESTMHLIGEGRIRASAFYEQLAKQFAPELNALAAKLYP